MMKLRLYSNCRLTKEYNEVIQHEYLEGYLATLTSTLYEIDDVYLTRRGQFTLDILDLGIFQYNYFKLEDTTNNITRYFFIDEAEIVNGSCIIEYSEDIWSSYAHEVTIIRGMTSNLRYHDQIRPRYLPVNYISNKKLSIVKVDNNLSVNGDFYVVVEFSLYKLSATGQVSERTNYCGVITGINDYRPTFYTFSACEVWLRNLTLDMGIGKNATIDDGTNWLSFDIIKAYIIPAGYFGPDYTNTHVIFTSKEETIGTRNACLRVISPYMNSMQAQTINSNYKRYGFGLYNHIISIEENGLPIHYQLSSCVDENRFTLILNVGTNIIDITDSFEYEFAISSQTADVTQQQSIARAIKNNQLDISRKETITRGAISLVGDVGGAVASGVSYNFLGVAQGIASGVGDALSIKYELERNSLDKWQTNQESYKTNSSIITNSQLKLVCEYGLCSFIITSDNDFEVNYLLDTMGYKTNVGDDGLFITRPQEDKTYNIVKYSNVWLKGNLPSSILDIIKTILLKGIKIYFTSRII